MLKKYQGVLKSMSFLLNPWLFFPLMTLSIFFTFYFSANRIIDFFYNKSFGTRKYVIDVMDKMLWNFDKEKMTLIILMVVFGFGLLLFLLLLPNVLLGLMGALGFIVFSSVVLKSFMDQLWEKRCSRVVDQMVVGMTILSNGVKAGLSVTQSMERVCINVKGPLSAEFKLVLNKVRLGMTLEDALNELGQRISKPDIVIFVTAVNILKETGGNLAETFETITQTIRERQKVQKKIEALTAQGMMQGLIMSCIPFLLFFIFLVISPDFLMPVFKHPIGWFLLALAVFLVILGSIFMRKIVKIDI